MSLFPSPNSSTFGANLHWSTTITAINGTQVITTQTGTGTGPTTSRLAETTATPMSGLTTLTTDIPVTTVTQDTTTFISFSHATLTTIITSSPSSTSLASSQFTPPPSQAPSETTSSSITSGTAVSGSLGKVCIGDGLDSSAEGILAAIIVPSAIGLIIWLIFAILRPRFRQAYGLREWFVSQDLRPKPLGSSFFAFLFPHVPLVPDMPSDVSEVGKSNASDAELFPSDEQLTQRALWVALLIVMGWSVIALGGALPLYLVGLPCLAELPTTTTYGGSYSTLQDMSLSRLLKLIDAQNVDVTTSFVSLLRRAEPDDVATRNIRIRIIILTVLTLVLALLPALWKIIREFNKLVAYRKRWVEVRCEGQEMGWLSARDAPGFVGWGEKRLKDFILRTGLSSTLEKNKVGTSRRRRETKDQALNSEEKANLQVDIQALFSIGDTQRLAHLIDERDAILEGLEIAETQYIRSFRLTTPDPSIADWEPPAVADTSRPYISRPKALDRSQRRKRALNPAPAASSLAPTSFVAPSQYYTLRGVRGVTGGRFTDSIHNDGTSFTDSINARLGNSRYDTRGSGHVPLGSQIGVDEFGQPIHADTDSISFPDPRRYGPNQVPRDSAATSEQHLTALEEEGEGWVDLEGETSPNMASDYNGRPPVARGQHSKETTSSTKRETFPFRYRSRTTPEIEEVPPPHLRLQPSQPFVRPLDGIDFDHLGGVYGDITQWRTRLKAINAEISDAQANAYTDIADGARIKGWLLIGKGLRFIPSIQIIEGRAKEDIRWDVLQSERTGLDTAVLWAVIGIVVIFLAAGLTAASGLALSTAPDFAHFLPFLQPLQEGNELASGLATVLAPAVGASLFIILALVTVKWAADIRGAVSISASQLFIFRATFIILTAVAGLWIIAVGAVLFTLQSFSTKSGEAQSVADGSIYISILALAIIMQVAIIVPGLLLLQPHRLWRLLRSQRQAITPRQNFRAIYPRTYDPSFATGACILAIVFASTFALIFPLICPAVVVLLLLSLVAHRFLIGYVYGRTHSQTGGLLQIWLIRRFGSLLAFQPILLGLIFLSREFWIEGGVLVGAGVAVIVFVECYTRWKLRQPGRNSLSAITRDSLDTFFKRARPARGGKVDDEGTSLVSSGPNALTRGSMASVLEMMSLTLAVMPSPSPSRGPVPLQTESLDDLTATERAARTHPDALPHLPPLAFTDHAEDMAGILYAPELIAPPPIIWLPNDAAGVAQSEAVDLQKYHDLQVTLDVRKKEDVAHLRSSPSHSY